MTPEARTASISNFGSLAVKCTELIAASWPLSSADNPAPFEHIARLRDHAGQRRDLFGISRDGRNLMATVGQFFENARSGLTGGADESNFHFDLLGSM